MSFLGAPVTAAEQPFSREQLDQLTAQVALYPDALLSQVLMASTYQDLGPQTASIARAMKAYEPDATWKKADVND